ncbi:anhydro-N-acetylmuramic acid kinase [Sulfurimonas sp. C5]|uniref:anhydro-N-acetylmuramic acid kinase n=1 Tax=Sulfurimonas sp. C5 TaxID=3036947 RepID=UPI002456643C|nr:anhydro-N-acetylmuramic acid kinase [Sulfurimonas sp. C5]MDH4944321.1 anhydro-N-acetylmuramic acid kinase [Sulfurimonas sp. C5]
MAKYIGVMSGTSLDGIDLVLCEIDQSTCTLLKAGEFSYDQSLKTEILDMIHSTTTLKAIGELDVKLGKMFASAINTFIEQNKIYKEEITAIGLHGQTLWHEPNSEHPFSMQLGKSSVVAAQTGLQVVSDFRSNDIANGGQGAPFAPAFHHFVFDRLYKNIAVVNIGGMANITLLGDKYLGWDSGCGNVLLDYWIEKTQNKPYDKEGEFAKSGKLNEALLNKMLDDPYFSKKPPKSTGREYFNPTWLEHYLIKFSDLSDADIQATLTELTAQTIAKDCTDAEDIILCGGGAKNSYLQERIADLSQKSVKTTNDYGVDSDFLEAMIFAWLAHKRIHEEHVDLQSVTGAQKNSILGVITCN